MKSTSHAIGSKIGTDRPLAAAVQSRPQMAFLARPRHRFALVAAVKALLH
jgi:hypothetical protein